MGCAGAGQLSTTSDLRKEVRATAALFVKRKHIVATIIPRVSASARWCGEIKSARHETNVVEKTGVVSLNHWRFAGLSLSFARHVGVFEKQIHVLHRCRSE